eukprot:scaffold286452_cov15-Tisochrysis_lutea.AAC.1
MPVWGARALVCMVCRDSWCAFSCPGLASCIYFYSIQRNKGFVAQNVRQIQSRYTELVDYTHAVCLKYMIKLEVTTFLLILPLVYNDAPFDRSDAVSVWLLALQGVLLVQLV